MWKVAAVAVPVDRSSSRAEGHGTLEEEEEAGAVMTLVVAVAVAVAAVGVPPEQAAEEALAAEAVAVHQEALLEGDGRRLKGEGADRPAAEDRPSRELFRLHRAERRAACPLEFSRFYCLPARP
jgi:hypothetical protein